LKYWIYIFIFCALPFTCYSKAWNQEKGKTYLSQKLILKPSYSSHSTSKSPLYQYLSPSAKDDFFIERDTKERAVESYFEFGFSENTTFIGKITASDIRDKIELNLTPNGHNHYSKLPFSYYETSIKLGATNNLIKHNDHILSTTFSITPTQYLISNYNNKSVPENTKFSISLNYGRSLHSTKPFSIDSYEFDIGYHYYPKPNASSASLNISVSSKPTDSWSFTIGSYNTFNSYKRSSKPYIEALSGYIKKSHINQQYVDYYINSIKNLSNSSELKNIHQIQLKVACLISENKEIELNLFIDPLRKKDNDNSCLLIALNERF
jgi:hypothetical protein